MAIEHRKDALEPGVTLHSYRIIEVLGSGAFGITYLAEHNLLNTRHVIKEYLPDSALREHESATVTPKSTSDTELFRWGLDSFFQEARFVHELSHPNIVKVSDLFEANGTAYFVMPFLDGITLHEWIKENPNPAQTQLIEIFVPILEGLKYIHQKNLLHRDIKPENIYITENGNPVLIDFGAARLAIGEKSRALTQVLTPHFAPWEQYRSKGDFTPALDYYSLAACMYQAITGEMPEEAPNRLETDPIVPLANIDSYQQNYSAAFLHAVDKGLAVHAKDRFQDAFSFQLALMEHDAPASHAAAPSSAPVIKAARDDEKLHEPLASTPQKKRSKLPIILSIFVVLGLVAGGGYWFLSQSENKEESPVVQTNDEPTAREEEADENTSAAEVVEEAFEPPAEIVELNTQADDVQEDEEGVAANEAAANQAAEREQQLRAEEQALWSAATQANTIASYSNYLDNCVRCDNKTRAENEIETQRAEEARREAQRADQALWNEVSSARTESAYQRYIDQCQVCEQRNQAREALQSLVAAREAAAADRRLWQETQQANTENSYARYLEQCSRCEFRTQAQQEFNRLRDQRVALEQAMAQEYREQTAWERALEQNSIDAYAEYLETCVNCDYRADAEAAMDLISRLDERVTVGPAGADFSSIQEAIDAVQPGATIEIQPGEYKESIRVFKEVHLLGSDNTKRSSIVGERGYAIHLRAANASVTNLVVRQLESPSAIYAIFIEQGQPRLENLDIRSSSGAAIAITNGASPTITNNEIHSGSQAGLFIYEGGLGVIENNRIHGHELANIEIRGQGTAPTIRGNEIFQSQDSGIYSHNGAEGRIENNTIRNNALAGIFVTGESSLQIVNNEIRDNSEEGIVITEQASPHIADNQIRGNQRANIAVSNGAEPTVTGNSISAGNASGIFVYQQGLGTFRNNKIFQHRLSNIVITDGAEPEFVNNEIYESAQVGVFVYDNGRGLFTDNDIYNNVIANAEIRSGAAVTFRANKLRGSEVGLYLHEQGTGEFENNEILDNTVVGIALATDANPVFQNNRITGNTDGVAAYPRARGTFRGNEVRQNQDRDWAIAQGANISRR
ncbi:MAG: parallel beta-helix repeat domain protein [Idiomarinaceae bacterium HL-53]|nr:MAG: parallel beta-helix repeat domain protein [Idiomarinaceae bacterium HL-53]CUS48995.1 parallel beta-helix repeat (two copies) [Idiomarinaceae bacterium HL-53]